MKQYILNRLTRVIDSVVERKLLEKYNSSAFLDLLEDYQDSAVFHLIRNLHLGKRCFIIGNGPSLTVADLNKLKNEYTFASNKIYLCFDETDWRPTFYSVEDPKVMQNNVDEIKRMKQTLKLFPHHMKQFYSKDKNSFFCRFVGAPNRINKNVSPLERNFSLDISECIHWGSTITYSLIQHAVHMGFREIYLLGTDHSYIIPSQKEEDGYISEGEVNHFHKDYRKPGEKWNDPRVDVLTRSYEFAYETCNAIGVDIYNASRSTKLDVFPKVNLDEILEATY